MHWSNSLLGKLQVPLKISFGIRGLSAKDHLADWPISKCPSPDEGPRGPWTCPQRSAQ
jgi:hypothetical protein